jgi:predicted DNA-binding protein
MKPQKKKSGQSKKIQFPSTMAFRTTEEEKTRISEFCEQNRITKSEFLREVITKLKLDKS